MFGLQLLHFRDLLLHAHHLFALIHNRDMRQEPTGEVDMSDMSERFEFVYRSHRLRYLMMLMDINDFPTATPISNEPIDWVTPFRRVHRLCYRQGAINEHSNIRYTDYRVLLGALNAAWQWGGNNEPLLPVEGMPQNQQPQVSARICTKNLLQAVGDVLQLMVENRRLHFSASYSFFIISRVYEILRLVEDVERTDAAVFCRRGPNSRFAYEVGTFLAHRLLEEEPDDLELVRLEQGTADWENRT